MIELPFPAGKGMVIPAAVGRGVRPQPRPTSPFRFSASDRVHAPSVAPTDSTHRLAAALARRPLFVVASFITLCYNEFSKYEWS